MYIGHLDIAAFRTFRKASLDFVHAQQDFAALGMPAPRLRNMNLLLGNNGSGKSSVLRAIALAALGPAVVDSGIYPDRLVRREPKVVGKIQLGREAAIDAVFVPHEQDLLTARLPNSRGKTSASLAPELRPLHSEVRVFRKTDLEQLRWLGHHEISEGESEKDWQDDMKEDYPRRWEPIFSSQSQAFFVAGYGATRRVDRAESAPSSRERRVFERAQRVMSLFEDDTPLVPLARWLPALKTVNKGRYAQVVHLIDRLLVGEKYHFTGQMEGQEFLFERGGLGVPFRNLSDGYRGYLGWICDLLYHICSTCPPAGKLVDNFGMVLVDEIDLHLHPQWQMTVLQTLSKVLPNIQFVVTSHSPLVVSSLEWMNIIVMQPGPGQSSVARRIEWAVHGLDADQVLLTDFFGLESTRAAGKKRQLKDLSLKARDGDSDAALKLLQQMSAGVEMAK